MDNQKALQKVQLFDSFKKDVSLRKLLQQNMLKKKQQLWFDKYQIKRYLGEGACATVLKAINIQTQKIVALKVIDLEAVDIKFQNFEFREKIKKYLTTQETNMMKCKSAHVVKIYQTYQNQVSKVFVMEYCNSETLEHYLRRKGQLKEQDAIAALKDIIFGVAEMHRNGLIHRDLKPANILIHQGTYKVADLGFSKELSMDESMQEHTVVGTRTTMAPQVVNKDAYNFRADIWSVGIIFFLMLFFDRDQTLPQNYKRVDKFLKCKKKGKMAYFPSQSVSFQSLDFLMKILEVDQEKRLDWEEALDHSIFIRKDKRLPKNLQFIRFDIQEALRESNLTKNAYQSQQISSESQQRVRVTKDTSALISSSTSQLKNSTLLKKVYFEYRKVECILNNIVTPIEEFIDRQSNKHIQLLYLILSKCLNCINDGKIIVIQNYSQSIVNDFLAQIIFLEQKIKIKKHFMTILMNKTIEEIDQILEEKLNKYISTKNVEKNKNSEKISQQGDVQISQYISFIEEMYMMSVMKELRLRQSDKKKNAKMMLKFYRKLILLEENKLKGVDLQEWVFANFNK